jgi:peptidoglycan-N-acetylglucosamine deacetylase
VLTSWDDGHALDNKLANLLLRFGVKGTFYVPVTNRGISIGPGLGDSDLLRLSKNFEMGSHTVSHPILTRLSTDQASVEIRDSKRLLSEIINQEVQSFSYPGGEFNSNIEKLVKEAGYKNARSTRSFCVTRADSLYHGQYDIGCSLQAKNKPIITKKAFLKEAYLFRHLWALELLNKFRDWGSLAKALFEKAYSSSGVFHLWGHSWEIERNEDWGTLENVLSYIGERRDVSYQTISEFVSTKENISETQNMGEKEVST